MRLAEKGFDVIATVGIWGQVQPLKRAAAKRGVKLVVEKLDVTNDGDRKQALAWDIEILVNDAGTMEGGSVADVPGWNMRNQFEVDVIGPLLLTQGIAKQMAKRKQGRIVWVSSREGINVNPFTGICSASKHAVEAIAETMSLELREFRVEVATVNPGPFLTGFNHRGFDCYKSWLDDPSERLFDYSKLAFARAQFDPEAVYSVEGTDINRDRIAAHVENTLMLVTAISPVIGYQNAAHIAEDADATGSTLREAALKSGKVSADQYDRIIVPKHMIGTGLAGA